MICLFVCAMCSTHSMAATILLYFPLSVHYWRELCREACRDPTNLKRLASRAERLTANPVDLSSNTRTVRKKDLILHSIERRPQMQFSMARKFPLWRLRRYSVKHFKMRNFTFDALWPRKTKGNRLGANQHPLYL